MIELITFDCAQTLVEVSWSVRTFIETCGRAVGLEVDSAAYDRYARSVHLRWGEYLEVNLMRDPVAGQAFWDDIGRTWLAQEGLDPELIHEIRETSHHIGFTAESEIFRLYSDVPDCLTALRARGIKLAVVSNWDYTLHRVLEMFGIRDHFDAVFASLEEGVEKPDPRLFHICLQQLGVSPENTVHIGDNPVDDVEGALAAGIRPVLIARDPDATGDIRSLTELKNHLWPN